MQIKLHPPKHTEPSPAQSDFKLYFAICDRIMELQETISQRPEGERYPTKQEALLQAQLINMMDACATRIKRQTPPAARSLE